MLASVATRNCSRDLGTILNTIMSEEIHDFEADGRSSGGVPRRPTLSAANRAIAFGVAGWLVPGLGHALQKMWGRAVACFLTVAALVWIGAGLRGNLFTSQGGDAFASLGYVADLGAGTFYVLARTLETQGPDVSHADGDYGTRFLAAAGVLNLLAALHAYEAARGRKA